MYLEDFEVKLFKALGHPIRLKIVKKLMKETRCVCELVEDMDSSQSSLSQHLKILKDSGILASEKIGYRINYRIYNDKVRNIILLCEEMISENIKKIK